ncbi:uncharacterized protein LOC122257519 [Penaeus japonicus]|uniref:uncharacterized protein LOC122257519 n=1 Tax=Penaeus japonicus TaxID=27405 RepID=UPI001C71060D|nr:uncharacterized protein LOC122257519 [Penaeus japonicus]
MERGFGYARERPGPWQDYFPRDRDEGIYYRDPQSYYSRQAHQPQHARYYGPEERVNGRRYEPPFEENKVVRGHRKEPSDPKEIGFSYTSGIRNMQDIKFRQMHQPPRRHEGRDAAFDHRRERRESENGLSAQ